jgi:hypothetical protein
MFFRKWSTLHIRTQIYIYTVMAVYRFSVRGSRVNDTNQPPTAGEGETRWGRKLRVTFIGTSFVGCVYGEGFILFTVHSYPGKDQSGVHLSSSMKRNILRMNVSTDSSSPVRRLEIKWRYSSSLYKEGWNNFLPEAGGGRGTVLGNAPTYAGCGEGRFMYNDAKIGDSEVFWGPNRPHEKPQV